MENNPEQFLREENENKPEMQTENSEIKPEEPVDIGIGENLEEMQIKDDAKTEMEIESTEIALDEAYGKGKVATEEKDGPIVEDKENYSSTMERVAEIIEKEGIKFQVIKTENCGSFKEAIIFPKEEIPKEKMVRIYRGIKNIDETILSQEPYAIRSENESGKPKIIEQVREEVNRLAEDPTYENLVTYIEKVKPFLTEKEIKYMEDELSGPSGIEDGFEWGQTARYGLLFGQVRHGARFGERGIQPYISATYNIDEANAYGDGILVIDLPASKIEDFSEKVEDETRIKGSLDKKYITGILLKDYKYYESSSQANTGENKKETRARKAVAKLSDAIEIPLFANKEVGKIQKEKFAESRKWDEGQLPKDLDAFYTYSAKRLLELFPEANINVDDRMSPSELRSKIQRDIFDYYANLVDIIDREVNHDRSNFESKRYTFEDDRIREEKDFDNWNRRHIFDREKITDTMLIELRKLYEQKHNYQLRLEKRNRENEIKREEWKR
jgi:hypothetical protein